MLIIGISFIFGLLVLTIIIIFSFPRFSPIPYFPSNNKDIPLILNALNIRNNLTIIDLGAGDGIVILKAAEQAFHNKLNTKFIAVEINPILLLVLHVRRLFHFNRKNIRIINADMFTLNYTQITHSNLVTYYIYISPWFIEKTILNITKQIKKFRLISYFYQVKYLPKHTEELQKGVHAIYSYTPHR